MIYCNIKRAVWVVVLALIFTACKTPLANQKSVNDAVPEFYADAQDTVNAADQNWKEFFSDPYLNALIDTALNNNQELNITLQEIQIAKNEVRERKGEYLPFVHLGAGAGVEKTARYTPLGANEATTEIEPGREMPEPVPDFMLGGYASWELDIWKKLRNSKKAAVFNYLASVEGRNFMQTKLIAEIANSYYELLALDNQLAIVKQNLDIQRNALKIVKQEKAAAKVTELAVQRFQAEVLKNRSRLFTIQQQVIETENRINFLLGRYPQPIERNNGNLLELIPQDVSSGIPSQLLENRPDIQQAEMALEAAKLNVKVARARFYPSLGISAGIGLRAFDPSYLVKTPESMLYSLAGDVMAPLINRNAIKAAYSTANSKQIQAIYEYERVILNAYIEVVNELSNINNLKQSFDLREQEVKALTESIKISNDLFKSARADYMEVLLTQRDALESTFELIETQMQQMNARVNLYRKLGGGKN